MTRAIIVLKTRADLDSIDNTISQWNQLTYECSKRGVQVVGRVLTTAGFKDVLKKIKKLDKTNEFHIVLMYSPKQFTDSKCDYLDFVEEVNCAFKAKVIPLRS